MAKKRVQSHILEKVIGTLMVIFGVAAIYIFIQTWKTSDILPQEIAMIEILLIIVLAILAQTVVLIRIYEQHEN